MRTRVLGMMLFVLLLSQFMTGCTEHYRTDYIKKFNSYLEYSLGEFKVTDENKVKWRANPLPVSGTGKRWVVAFTDDRGFRREFEFQNYGYTNGGDESNFGYAVMDYAIALGEDQITKDVLLKHFRPDEIGLDGYRTNQTKVSVALFNENPSEDAYFAKFVDPQHGVQLKSIHPKQLVNDWGVSY